MWTRSFTASCILVFLSTINELQALSITQTAYSLGEQAVQPGRATAQAGARRNPPLMPRPGSSSFKVLQLADLHLGEDFEGKWGPEQDRKTLAVVASLLDEEKPDLVVFSGDQLTGEGLQQSGAQKEQLLKAMEEPLKRRGVPWATVFGNHDACETPGCKDPAGIASLVQAAPTQAE